MGWQPKLVEDDKDKVVLVDGQQGEVVEEGMEEKVMEEDSCSTKGK